MSLVLTMMEDDAHVSDVGRRCCVLTMIEYDTHVVDDGPRCCVLQDDVHVADDG